MSIETGHHETIGSSSRVKAYSDAVFSIVATVMVLPITHKEIDPEIPLSKILIDMIPTFTVYFTSFFLTGTVWNMHVLLFDTVEKADEILVFWNLFLMMGITFLPFAFTLAGTLPSEPFAMLMYCGVSLAVFSLMIFMIFHVFRKPGIQPIDFVNNPDRMRKRNMLYIHAIVPAVLCVIAASLAFILPGVAATFFFFTAALFNILIARRVGQFIDWYRRRKDQVTDQVTLPWLFQTKHVDKERVECFSDGVFAIVATLIILDICEDIPDEDSVKHEGGFSIAMEKMAPTFLSYFSTFTTVALLWFVHHSVFQYIKEVSRAMGFFNMLCLASVGFFPFGFKVATNFDMHTFADNDMVSVQLTSTIIFIASISQCILWVIALYKPLKYVHPEASFNGRYHVYTAVKLAIYPVVSLLMFFLSFDSATFTARAFDAMQICTPLFFVALRLLDVLVSNIKQKRQQTSQQNLTDVDDSQIHNSSEFQSDDRDKII